MSIAIIHSRAQVGIDAPAVTVEVDLAHGLPALSIVGLPEAAVKESKDRVRSAITNARFDFPARRITINLAPADLPKEGGRFDLPIALGVLAASGQLNCEMLDQYEFLGELALTGELRPTSGILPAALRVGQDQRTLIVPRACADEAALATHTQVLAAGHLLEVVAHINGEQELRPHQCTRLNYSAHQNLASDQDLSQIIGQHQAKRALEIAAAGGHSLLLVGPPGAGKTMLASRLPGILPPLEETQAIETAAIHSISQSGFRLEEWRQRHFRAPHHTASAVALVGGGSHPRPGEISLAHHGVLFLDELPEFDRHVLEVLREPLESGVIRISRAARQAEFPARFQLIAAMNPCPCGYADDPSGRCHCSPDQIRRYQRRVSGPLMDRIDMHVAVRAVPHEQLLAHRQDHGEHSDAVRDRVMRARESQLARAGMLNHALSTMQIDRDCALDQTSQALLERAMSRLGLSARGYHRILRVARTIADLAGASTISSDHLAEAIQYRQLDRMSAG